MSLLNRVVSIFKAKANTVLDELENPKEALEFSLVEMREQVNKIKKSLVEVSAIKKKLEGDLEDTKDKIKLLDEQSDMAVSLNRDDLAKEALSRKQDLMEQQKRMEKQIDELNEKIRVIGQNKEQLEKRIYELQIKKDELIAMNAAADAQLKVKETLAGISDDITSINERLERVENKIKQKNARVNAIDELVDLGTLGESSGKDALEMELKKFEREEQIKKELERLKKKHEGGNA